MTIQPSGYPDFQAPPQWRSGNLFASLNTNLVNGSNLQPVITTVNFASMQLSVIPASIGVIVSLNWCVNPDGTGNISTDIWQTIPACALDTLIPVRSQYLQVNLVNTQPAAQVAQTYLAGTNVAVGRPTYPVTQDNIQLNAVSIPASTTQVLYRSRIHSGNGQIHIEPGDVAGKINYRIQAYDASNNPIARLYTLTGPTAPVDFEFPYPDTIVGLSVINSDGAAPHVTSVTMWSADY